MRRILTFLQLILPVAVLFWAPIPIYVLAQEVIENTGMPLPPPVEITFTLEGTPKVGEEVVLKLKVTPLEDMHADISCLMPEGIEPVREEGLMLLPYMDRGWPPNIERYTRYRGAINLYAGPLKGSSTKEFMFHIKILRKGRYELITRVEGLAKWGVKEEVLVVEVK